MNRLPLLLRLARNGLRYHIARLTGASCPIQALSLEITYRCIARCTMCNIWKIPTTVQDLPLSEWIKLLASSELKQLREIDITGGEPFLRDDIVNLVEAISHNKPELYAKLRTVAVTTNGILTQRILNEAEVMADCLKRRHIDLVFAVAVDAIGEVHEEIRGVSGAWPKVLQTIDGLCKMRRAFPNLVVGLKTTVVPANVDHLTSIAMFARDRGLFTIISPRILTNARYANLDRSKELRFSDKDLEELASFYSTELFPWSHHRKVLLNYFRTGGVDKPCTTGFNYFFIRSTGDVYPCPLINYSIGNILDKSFENLVRSRQASRFRRTAGTHQECLICTEPGLERYALPFEGLSYAAVMFRMKRADFEKLHSLMGLDKYFE
ncbi:MAG: radical SAM protein [Desulfomonilaceae bacterium]